MIDIEKEKLNNDDIFLIYDVLKETKVKIIWKYNISKEEETGVIRKRGNEYLFFENGELNRLYRNQSRVSEIHGNEHLEKKALKILKLKKLFRKGETKK
jgi:hypothetical protein